jgi:hypothetical protein
MMVAGWSNGSPNPVTGAGYGIRIVRIDRDRDFRPDWTDVCVQLNGGDTALVSISPSFWRSCSELRSSSIGLWML